MGSQKVRHNWSNWAKPTCSKQNNLLKKCKSDHKNLPLKTLEWLPSTFVKYKVLTLTWDTLHGRIPSFYSGLIYDYNSASKLCSKLILQWFSSLSIKLAALTSQISEGSCMTHQDNVAKKSFLHDIISPYYIASCLTASFYLPIHPSILLLESKLYWNRELVLFYSVSLSHHTVSDI